MLSPVGTRSCSYVHGDNSKMPVAQVNGVFLGGSYECAAQKKGTTPKRIANGRLPCSGDTSGEIDVMWVLNCALMCMGINLGVLYASHKKRENMPHGFTRSLGMVAKSRRSSPRPLVHLAPCQEKQTGSHGGCQVPRHLAPPAWLGVNTARVPHSSHHHRKRKPRRKRRALCLNHHNVSCVLEGSCGPPNLPHIPPANGSSRMPPSMGGYCG